MSMTLDQVRYIATGGNGAHEFTIMERELAQYLLDARRVLHTMVDEFGTPAWCAMIIGARDMKDQRELNPVENGGPK